VRTVSLDGAADGSIEAAVPAGALVWLMESDRASVLDATDAACHAAIAALGEDEEPQALLLFDCSARLEFLRDDADDEIARILAVAGGATVAGLSTNGEIARIRGINGLHHQTLVVLALA
jgi:hypothetical protein